MISRHGWVVAAVVLPLVLCSRNPVDIDDKDEPQAIQMYSRYGFRQLLADDDGTYWATTGNGLEHIERDSAGVWQYRAGYSGRSLEGVTLFQDSLGIRSYISRDQIGHLADSSVWTSLHNLPSSDPRNREP